MAAPARSALPAGCARGAGILHLLQGAAAIGMELELFGRGAQSGRDLLCQAVHLGADDRAAKPERESTRSRHLSNYRHFGERLHSSDGEALLRSKSGVRRCPGHRMRANWCPAFPDYHIYYPSRSQRMQAASVSGQVCQAQTGRCRLETLAELAVLVSPTVDTSNLWLRVARCLAGHAGPNPRERLATPFRNRLPTFDAMGLARARRHSGPRYQHRIHDSVVDLILHRAVARPSAGHPDFLYRYRE
jgi:hypothetical protein